MPLVPSTPPPDHPGITHCAGFTARLGADIDHRMTARLLSGMINSIVEWYRPAAPVSLADAVCAVAFDGLILRE
jgi:hypothetical protein